MVFDNIAFFYSLFVSKPVEVENVGFKKDFAKSFTGQKNGKNSFSVIDELPHTLSFRNCLLLLPYEVKNLRFSNMYSTYVSTSFM